MIQPKCKVPSSVHYIRGSQPLGRVPVLGLEGPSWTRKVTKLVYLCYSIVTCK